MITLYGEVTPGAPCVQVEVRFPSMKNVRGVQGWGWFTTETFLVSADAGAEERGDGAGEEDKVDKGGDTRVDASPKKKHKNSSYSLSSASAHAKPNANTKADADLEARWTDAVNAMRESQIGLQKVEMSDEEDDDEGMFGIESSPSKSMSKGKGDANEKGWGRPKGRGKLSTADATEDDDEDGDTMVVTHSSPSPTRDRWTPPPPDPSLDIPGEKVFARENGRRGRSKSTVQSPIKKNQKNKVDLNAIHWPAILNYYKAPEKPGEEAKYGVEFLNGEEMEITRDMFYNSDQDGFALCKVRFVCFIGW